MVSVIRMAKAIASSKDGNATFDFDVLTGTKRGALDVMFLDPSTSVWGGLGSYSTDEQVKRAVSDKINDYGYNNPIFYGI